MYSKFKRCLSVVLLVLLMMSTVATSVPAFAATVKTKSIKLDQTGTVKLNLGETLTLTATLTPEDSTQKITWKSSKSKIAKVSKSGVVTAKKTGTTVITAKSGSKKASVKIKVVDPTLPTSVSLNLSGTQTLLVSNALQLSATLYPETATSGLKWKSSNKRVAIVNKNGLVGGLAPGKTTITVTTRNNKKAKIKIKVIDDGKQPIVPPEGYDLPYVIYCCKNTHTIAIIAKDANGEWTRVLRKFPTGMGRKNVTDVGFFSISRKERWHKWGSGYSPYANKLSIGIYLHGPIYKSKNHNTIRPEYYNCIGTDCSSGCIRTVCGCAGWVYYNCPVGTMVIVAQNSRFSEPRPKKIGKKATTDPTDPGVGNFEILMTSFTLNPDKLEMKKGETKTITPTNIRPASTTTKGFKYLTSDSAVATVNASGVVTAVGPGTATILVTGDDDFAYSVELPVTVTSGTLSEGSALMESQNALTEEAPAFQAEEDNGLTSETEAVPEEINEIVVEE